MAKNKNKGRKSITKPKEVKKQDEERSEEPFSGESDENQDRPAADNSQATDTAQGRDNEENKMGKFKGEPLKMPVKRRGSKFDMQFDTNSPLLRPEFVYSENEDTNKKFWALMDTYQGTDK